MTTVFFIRHGPTEENIEGRIQGQLPGTLIVPKTERYLAAIVPLLRPQNPRLLLSSDLERAVRTRKILKDFLQLKGIKEAQTPLLREKGMGFYEGRLWSEVPEEFKRQLAGKSSYDFHQFGGESDRDVRRRVRKALLWVARRYPDTRIVCVTHGGWLRQLAEMTGADGVLPDGWINRAAICEGGLKRGAGGRLRYLRPIDIKAKYQLEKEE